MTSLIVRSVIITFFLSNIFRCEFEKIFTSSRARNFFGARKFSSFRHYETKSVTSFSSLSIPSLRADIVRDDDVAILFAQLFRGVFFEVIRFRGETNEKKIAVLSLA